MSLAIFSRSGVRRIPFSELQICGCCLSNGDDALLTCAKCSVLVHAHCYYDQSQDPSTWLCQPCATLSPEERETIVCCICNQPGGAMKATDDDGWAHVCCALWTPETYIPNGDMICGVTDIHVTRKSLRCTFCKKIGGCVQCSVGKCITSFHLTCACQHGLQLSLENHDGTLVPISVCHRHKQSTRKLVKTTPVTSTPNIREEDAVCDVCGHDSVTEGNDIVICDGCDIGVHQNCYGIDSIPEHQWFCQACSSERPGKCILCSDPEGALKQTTNGDWVHVVCALWSHQSYFFKPSSLDAVTGLDRLLLDDPDRQCQFCNDAAGFCCDCAAPGCSTYFHVRCARKDKRRVEFYDLENPSNPLNVLPRFSSLQSQSRLAFVVFCNVHQSAPFSADDYQRDHPFPSVDYSMHSDNEILLDSPPSTKKSSRKSGKVPSEGFVDDGKRSQADVFWQDEIQPYFEPPRVSALRLSKILERDLEVSFMVPPLGRIQSKSFHPHLPSFKSCDWICEQLDIPCLKAQRFYALLMRDNDAIFTNLQSNGTFINFCLVERSQPDGDFFHELSKQQRSLASQLVELDGFRKKLRSKIVRSYSESPKLQRDVASLHKDYVDMSHCQIVRLSLVAGFRDLDLAASDFTQEHFNTTCRVCFGTEGTEVNPIVICESCGLAVHKYCYGIEFIPEGDWLCDSCSGTSCPAPLKECALCPLTGFAFKSSDVEGLTVHLVCALWCPRVQILDMVKMAPITNVSQALSLPKFICDICQDCIGITVSCSHLGCSQQFHVTCGWEFGLYMEVRSVNGKPLYNCFCVSHTPEKVGGPLRDRLKQHELRLKARTQKPAQTYRPTESSVDQVSAIISSSAVPRVLDGEDMYLPDVCAVCFTFSQDDLVKCVNCYIAVHPGCYRIAKDLEQFRCIRCTAQPQRARKISCIYCPRLGGAYERHESSRWRHKACERWSLVYRNNGERLFQHVVCAICDRKEGSCISCTSQGCTTKFHALCGLFVDCQLQYEDDVFTALCPLHSPIRGDYIHGKNGSPDLLGFFDRLRLVRADMDELRTIMDLVKRREKIKKNISAIRLQMASNAIGVPKKSILGDNVGEPQNTEMEDIDQNHSSKSLGLILEDDSEDEVSSNELSMIQKDNAKNGSFELSPDRVSLDVTHGSVLLEDVEYPGELHLLESTVMEPNAIPRVSFARSNRGETGSLSQSYYCSAVPISTLQNDHANATEPAVESTAENEENKPDQEPVAVGSNHYKSLGSSVPDRRDDDSSDDESKRPVHRGSDDEKPRSRRQAESSSDEHEDDENHDSVEMNQKQLVTVQERRIGRFAIQFRIKIDRSQLPPSKVKVKKALLSTGSRSAGRGRRRSRPSRQASSDEDEENVATKDGSEVEATGRGRRRRSFRANPESDLDDFAYDVATPARRHTQRTASLAERRSKDSEDAPESISLNRTRWFPDEIEYLHEIVEDLDIDPDWDVVAKMMEDKFGTSFRVYTKNVVQTRWLRSAGTHSRKASPAAPASESTSQRTRWPSEELEFLRSLVANGNDEGKRNWHDIVRQMNRKFGRSYRVYTPQILQSKVHRLMNAPEPTEPKESTRKSAKSSSKSKWANEELEYLRGLVTKFGTDDWVTIADFMDKFLGERHRTYTGPILQKRWRELGPRGQAGPSQEIREDMIANPEKHAASSSQSGVEHLSDADHQEDLVSEEDFEEALSDDAPDRAKTVLKSPVIAPPDDFESDEVPVGSPVASALALEPSNGELPANLSAGKETTGGTAESAESPDDIIKAKFGIPKPSDDSVISRASPINPARSGVVHSPMTGSIKDVSTEAPFGDRENTPVENPVENAMDLDSGPGHVELRSPLSQAVKPPEQPLDLSLSLNQKEETLLGHLPSDSKAIRDAEDKFEEEVPWDLEPDEDSELLHAPMQQPPLLFAQSTEDSLFPGSFPPYMLSQGDRTSESKPKGNAWRPEEIEFLNELAANSTFNKDWELIASKMSDRFGTKFRKGYLGASIKQRWSKANPRTPKSGAPMAAPSALPTALTAAPVKDPRRPVSVKEAKRSEATADISDDPTVSKDEAEGISRTPYNREELAYLAELVEQFGSKDWSRVAQRMQLRFNDRYRRYAPMSLSMKWTRLRAKNQLPPKDSDEIPEEVAASTEPQPVQPIVDTSPVSTFQTPVSEPVERTIEAIDDDTTPVSAAIEEPDEVQPSAAPKSPPLASQAKPELIASPEQPAFVEPKVDQDVTLESHPEVESGTEPESSKELSPLRTAVTPKNRGKTPWSDEEVAFFRTQLLECGKDFKVILPKMNKKFGSSYRQYTVPALHARWAKVEKHESLVGPESISVQPTDKGDTPEEERAVSSPKSKLVAEQAISPIEANEHVSSKEVSAPQASDNDVAEETSNRRRRKRGGDTDIDAQESSKDSRRSRRRRSEVSESPLRMGSPDSSIAKNVMAKAAVDEKPPASSPLRVHSPRVSRSLVRDKTSETEAEQTSTTLEVHAPHSSRLTPSSRRSKAPWLPDELQYLRSTAQQDKFEWNAVAQKMNEKFGTERRVNGYTPVAVMTIYRRRFPGDGAPAKIKNITISNVNSEEKKKPAAPRPKAIKEPKSRSRPAKESESPTAPDAEPSTTHTDGSADKNLLRRRQAPSPGRNRLSPKQGRHLLSNEAAAIEKFAAAIESEVDSTKPAPRRRRRTELPPLTTPKRRRASVPGTEPRKPGPARSKIPNQGVNRLGRLLANIEEHDFSADQSNKALKFLRSHQSKWNQMRALAPGDRAWVLDSWQFKPYEIKVVEAFDEGSRYRIHYQNWSSKFDEDVSGEFVFRDSSEIRQVRSMADTYSKGR